MVSPISFGDAVAMAKIAWTVAHAFTKGRASAPAQFREVENQLYSLSTALSAFGDACGSDVSALAVDPAKLPARFQNEAQDGAETVSRILSNCGETLKHLEEIVNKHGVIVASKDPAKPRLRRWSAELVRNYRKIHWTTEKGDLAALRSQLMVHTNSLDLVLGIIVSSRTTRIEESLSKNNDMLKEIHSWWEQNLRDATTTTSPPTRNDQFQLGLAKAEESINFEACLESDGQLLCPRASLRDDWIEATAPGLFVCKCGETAPLNSSVAHPTVENIALSPLCFPFRRAGEAGSWTLYKALDQSTKQLVTVLIKNVPPSGVLEIEESFIQPLANTQASAMTQHGINNMLVHTSADGQHIRALNLQGDVRDLHKLVDTVIFRIGHRQLSKTGVEGLSLLSYREVDQQTPRPLSASAMGYAELAVYYSTADGPADVTKSIIQITHVTTIKLDDIDARVVVEGVECMGYLQDQQVHHLEKIDIVFQMTSLEAAKKLHRRIEDMRTDLFITSLQYPRADETVVLHLQATEVQCEAAVISDAELLITRGQDDQYRLIVASRNRCTVLTQILNDAFFDPTQPPASRFAAPTWRVQLEGSGKRQAYHYPDGLRYLRFRNANAERMFELGRSALLHGVPGQRLPIREKAGNEPDRDVDVEIASTS